MTKRWSEVSQRNSNRMFDDFWNFQRGSNPSLEVSRKRGRRNKVRGGKRPQIGRGEGQAVFTSSPGLDAEPRSSRGM